ncbi:SAS complex subunit [Elasticomyces elasticus]|uniref:histone acetyltransferase n=1 Tax=Exophiala sideris TaxID=1016849 RepID=A0ABR0JCP4_9EURO|nr:SAS complex subunit [Elasticomyces elasticus]KAK5031313.1 SAS complex subunit [Exophiala sideris]KAK5039033.1 SAS complex subunit [Exophiala sideris]KAK5060918.1 SAS complex subunit [Exophiala sideris]KAK5183829.1 SAS complex subunit [Eurotiomycetes sp. CCFEE 6388]
MPPAVGVEATSVLQEGSPHRARRASLRVLNRNIGQVVFGDLLFDTWYYSPYPDNIILGPEHQHAPHKHTGTAADLRNASVHTLNGDQPQCRRLYVCTFCFRYTPVEHDFMQHLQHHRNRREQGLETQPVPESAFKVYEWEGHTVWEIDGEKEKLYCQNLSLFGKLFLEQKSVFFDTGGFKYYALTYTKPASNTPVTKGRGRKRSSSVLEDDIFHETQVLGFFSKENLSWDANNLACILIFPPFQHRQLGQLLMAVSYKLSGWEWEGGIIGGPEKPLSAMGRRSYLRFWSERIARFFMGQSADADGKRVFHKTRKRTVNPRKEEMTVKDIGNRTGMLPEDVVAALTEMGICKVIMPKRKRKVSNEINGLASHADQPEPEELATMIVERSQILQWAEKNGVDLTSPVREEGFLGEWALSDLEGSEVIEDSGDASSV